MIGHSCVNVTDLLMKYYCPCIMKGEFHYLKNVYHLGLIFQAKTQNLSILTKSPSKSLF